MLFTYPNLQPFRKRMLTCKSHAISQLYLNRPNYIPYPTLLGIPAIVVPCLETHEAESRDPTIFDRQCSIQGRKPFLRGEYGLQAGLYFASLELFVAFCGRKVRQAQISSKAYPTRDYLHKICAIARPYRRFWTAAHGSFGRWHIEESRQVIAALKCATQSCLAFKSASGEGWIGVQRRMGRNTHC